METRQEIKSVRARALAYTKSKIRTKLCQLTRFREKQLGQRVIPSRGTNDAHRSTAISKINRFLAEWGRKDDQAHINLCLILRTEIEALMPGNKSKFQRLRDELIMLIDWSQQHHTLSERSRFHPANAS